MRLRFDCAKRLAIHFCASCLAFSDVPTVTGSLSLSLSGISHHRPKVGCRSSQGFGARLLSPYSKSTSAAGSALLAISSHLYDRFGFRTGFSIIAIEEENSCSLRNCNCLLRNNVVNNNLLSFGIMRIKSDELLR